VTEIPLILFAKAPIAGKVKTRLQSHCSPEQASEIAKILLEESILKTTQAWPGKVLLSIWLDHEHEFIQQMQQRYRIELVQQCEGDLGAKMANMLTRFGYPSVVMGCDVPQISGEVLASAYDYLCRGKSVIGPSNDGGYYLLGLQRPQPEIFVDMEWGVDTVLANTLQRAKEVELDLTELAILNDIDEWSDLLLAVRQLSNLENYLKHEGLLNETAESFYSNR